MNDKEVAIRKDSEPAVFGRANIEAKDLIVPTARILQKMSKALDTNPEYRTGEIRDSLSGELLGNETQPLRVVIFMTGKHWVIRENNQDKKFVRYEAYTAENCNRSWEFEEEEGPRTAHEVFNFTCLNVDDPTFPLVIPMASMAIKHAARKLTTIFAKLAAQGKPITSLVFEIRTQRLEALKGIFWVPSVTISKDAPSEIVSEQAESWWKKLQVVNAVHDVEDKSEDVPF